MATLTRTPRFTEEQKEAWRKAKFLLFKVSALSTKSRRALHIAMSELRAENGRRHKGPIETLPRSIGKCIQYEAIHRYERTKERVAEWKQYLTDPSAKKLYIIIRPDLSSAQKAVQASHATAQFQKEHPFAPWINGTMVLLEPNQSSTLWKHMPDYRADLNDFDAFDKFVGWFHATFKTEWREPDMGNHITAIAMTSDFLSDQLGSREDLKLI